MGVWVDEGLKPLAEKIAAALGVDALGWEIVKGELALTVRREAIVRVLTYLRDDEECKFGALMDVCGVDYPQRAERFDVVYNLLSMRHNRRIRVKVATNEDIPVPSVVGVFPSSSHPPIIYPVARVAGAANDNATAFLSYLKSPAAQDIFKAQGFKLLE